WKLHLWKRCLWKQRKRQPWERRKPRFHDTRRVATPAGCPEGSGAERAQRSGGGRSERRCSFGLSQASARNAPPGGLPASRPTARLKDRGLRRSHGGGIAAGATPSVG